ncbi:MAG: anthranilate synthase component I family protein, partial [Phycisphaeraceae bacterium]
SPPPTLPISSLGEGGYQRAVGTIKKYIAAGDAFQVVPSQRFEVRSEVDPFDVYRALRVVNPSPYMFYLQCEGAKLIGSSPEILVRVEPDDNGGKRIVNRPLAGTRRRGVTHDEDVRLEAELRNDPKDVAEHVMLVDLGRNDVGRIARPGTIELPAVLRVERYSHVMHLSSTVTGRLRDGATAWDALRYTLPVGTVSGAPKVRAMQIIDEVEATRRGPYGGAVGYADFAGNMDTCIALRTMVALKGGARGEQRGASSEQRGVSGDPSGGWRYHLQAGGGIVADSDPDAEHQETVNKAAALAKAIDLAERTFVHSHTPHRPSRS